MNKSIFKRLVIALSMLTFMEASAADVSYKMQAAIFAKVIGFNKNLSGDISIYVMGSDDMQASLKRAIGKKSGGGVIKSVTGGAALPGSKPSVIYIDKSIGNIAEVLQYCKDNGIMTITGNPSFVKDGATLGLKLAGGKPKILLGTAGSKEINIKWNPVILKLAEKV